MAEHLSTAPGTTPDPTDADTTAAGDAGVAMLTRDFRWLQARTAEALLDMDERHRLIGACAGTANPAVLEWVAARLDARPGQWIVDLGAGLGGSSSWMAARTGANVVALDGLAASVSGLRRLFPGIPAAVARVDALPLRDASADHAIALGLFDQTDGPEDLAASAARVLRPGGRLVAVFFASELRARDGAWAPRFHHTSTYLSTFHDAGFTDVRLDSLGDLPPPPDHWRRVRRRVEQLVERRHADDLRYAAARAERMRFLALQREGVIGLRGVVATRGD